MLEDKLHTVDPSSIKVSDDRPRQRKELGEIVALTESIRKYGQIQPIVVNRDMELIAGGRRLAACLMGGFQAKVCFSDELDPAILRELELEENLQRKSLTPAEEAFAIRDLVELKQKLYGKPTPGREGGFTLNDAADIIGKTKGTVIEAINIASMLEAFPNLTECKTKSDIKKAVKGLERVQQNMAALKSYAETISRTDEVILVNRPAEEYLKNIPSESVDLFFTDPPYGIDIHDLAMTVGGDTGGDITTTGITYDDSESYAKALLERLAFESYRITKTTGHAYIFCAPSHFPWLSARMADAGWLVAPRPVIWVKRETGQNNQPEKWFSAAYEFILFARKPSSCLILQGRPDWIQCNPVLPSERTHQAEKPVELCKELISRTCMPGQYMIDPCMGSGALVEAGLQMKLLVMGCEKEVESYAAAAARITKFRGGKVSEQTT
jgi:ParB family chromosome partitioning protein